MKQPNKPNNYSSPQRLRGRANKLFTLLFILLAAANISHAQLTPFEDWSNHTGTQNFFLRSVSFTDGNADIYVAGATLNGNGNYDILVTKFDKTGPVVWTQQIDGLAGYHDAATAIFVDASYNVYITGFIVDTLTHGSDVYTAKFNSSGTLQWSKRYNGPGNYHDTGSDIFVDASGNVYVTGGIHNTSLTTDALLIKYNSSGVQQWLSTYNSTYNLNDIGTNIAAIGSGRINVAGAIQTSANTYAYGIQTYSTTTGALVGGGISGTASSNIVEVNAMVKDAIGNCYLAGAINTGGGTGLDYCIIKADTNANILWESTWNGAANQNDVAKGICIDAYNNVYATGYSTSATQSTNYTTVKYNSSGAFVWAQHYNGAANGADTATSIILHNDTTLVVTGTSYNGSSYDYLTLKYDTTGTLLWQIAYNGADNLNDMAHALAIDTTGAIIVTGQSQTTTGLNYTTLRYEELNITAVLNDTIPMGNSIHFVQNQGQLINTDSLAVPGIRYYNNQGRYAKYFTDTLISFVYAKIDTAINANDTLHRVDMRFVNPSNNTRIRAFDIRDDYSNYYLPQTAPNGLGRVPHYNKLYMHQLWNKIDLQICSNPAGVKYAFILYPGFDPKDLDLLFEGHDNISIDGNGNLILETSIGNIILPRAKAFQLDSNNNYQSLGWQPDYDLNGNNISFTGLGSFNANLRLILLIEEDFTPMMGGSGDNLSWSTYFGGTGITEAITVTNDPSGNIYMSGYDETYDFSFPTYQGQNMTNAGLHDGFMAKFNSQRVRMWVTYCGGSDLDRVLSSVYFNGKMYYTGQTASSNFPALSQAGATNDLTLNSINDGFIVSLNASDGHRNWARFLGGNNIDAGTSLAADANYLYVVGYTASSDFPTQGLTGAYNNNALAFDGDIFIAKFNTQNQLVWSTYYGGNNNEQAFCAKLDGNGNLYISGFSKSTNFPTQNPGGGAYYVNTLAGQEDIVLLKFNSSGARQWATYFGGTGRDLPGYFNGHGMAVNNNGIFITGWTNSNNFPIYNYVGNCYVDSVYNGMQDAFIAGFNHSHQIIWSTYFGGPKYDLAYGIVSDAANNLFVTGFTLSDTAFPLASLLNAYSQGYEGGASINYTGDGFLSVFNHYDFSLAWSTYIGGSGSDYPSSGQDFPYGLAYYNNKLYLTGASSSHNPNYPLFDPGNGAYFQNSINGALSNAIISEFNLNSIVLSVSEDENNNLDNTDIIILYPNPAQEEIILTYNGAAQNMFLQISNALGQSVYEQRFNGHTHKINIAALSKGMYIINCYIYDGIYSAKFIKN